MPRKVSYRIISRPWKQLNIAMKALKINVETYRLGGDMGRWFVDLEPRLKAFQREYTEACKRWKNRTAKLKAEATKKKAPEARVSSKPKKAKRQL